MKSRIYLILLLLAPLIFKQEVVAQSRTDRIDSLMNARHQAGEFNGVVLVAVNGSIQYRKAFGLAENDRALKKDSPFYLGSVAKSFTGLAIMMLAEQEILSYDDKLNAYFPELPDFTENVTIRNLLNHTSGLPDYYAMGKYRDGMTNQMVMKIVLELKELEFSPGEEYSYSNTGYVLLSMLIERVTGNSYRKFLERQVFDPIGMEHSEVIDGTQPQMESRARGHTVGGQPDDYQALTTGAGGIYSTVDDLFLYDQALYENDLVRHKTLQQAFTPTRLNSGEMSYYGFGWFLETSDPKIVQHSGSLAGFRSFLYRDTGNKNTIILLSNFNNDVGTIKEDIVELIAQ